MSRPSFCPFTNQGNPSVLPTGEAPYTLTSLTPSLPSKLTCPYLCLLPHFSLSDWLVLIWSLSFTPRVVILCMGAKAVKIKSHSSVTPSRSYCNLDRGSVDSTRAPHWCQRFRLIGIGITGWGPRLFPASLSQSITAYPSPDQHHGQWPKISSQNKNSPWNF